MAKAGAATRITRGSYTKTIRQRRTSSVTAFITVFRIKGALPKSIGEMSRRGDRRVVVVVRRK